MKIDCISDLHGYYPDLEGGDLLIIAGDLTARDTEDELLQFHEWISQQQYKKTIIIAGNHDNTIQNSKIGYPFYNRPWAIEAHVMPYNKVEYLCDSGTEFEGLKIWGSPWTKTFEGINPYCKAFTVDTEEELAEKWALIPSDIDILITHSPSFGNYDWIKNPDGSIGPSVGSLSLWMKCLEIKPKAHIFGHIHEAYGHCTHENGIVIVNASHVNERYRPVNKPIGVII